MRSIHFMHAMRIKNIFNLTGCFAALAPTFLMAPICLMAAPTEKLNFQEHIRPIMREHCFNCHNPDKKKADLDLTTYDALLIGGSGGEVVSAGDAENSTLWLYTAHQEKPYMPPKKPMIPKGEMKIIADWINGGLKAHSGSQARIPKNKVNLASVQMSAGKPDGPPPMPEVNLPKSMLMGLSSDSAPSQIASSPWAPLVAFGYPHQILLYDTQKQALIGVLPFKPGHLTSLKFNLSGEILIAAGGMHAQSGQIVIYNIRTGEASPPIADELDAILSADLSSDQKLIALGSTNGSVKVIDLSEDRVAFTIRKKHTDWITNVAFSPDAKHLASSDRAGNLFLWYAQDGQQVEMLKGHKSRITSLLWRPDSKGLVTTDQDGYLYFWHADGKLIKKTKAHKKRISSSHINTKSQVVTSAYDGTVRVYDLNGKSLKSYQFKNELLLNIVWNQDRLIAGTDQGVFQIDSKGKPHQITLDF